MKEHRLGMSLAKFRLSKAFALALALVAALVLSATAQANAQFAVQRTSAADMFIEEGVPAQNSTYVSYLITNNSGNAHDNVWVRISNFTGGVVALGGNQPNKYPIGVLGNGASKAAFFYLSAGSTTTTPQSHDITVYLGDPDNGGVAQGAASTFTLTTVQDTIKAAANKITGGGVSPTGTVHLGEPITVTLNGQSGTLGAGPGGTVPANQLYFAGPSALSTFPANAFRIVSTKITFADTTVVNDHLSTTRASNSSINYTIEYTLQAVATTNAPTPVNPYAYINSGTQVKYTDPGTFGTISIPQVVQSLDLTLTATPATQAPGGTVTFTLTATNNGDQPVDMSNVAVTIANQFFTDGGTYNNGSATFNGGAIADPNIAANVLTFTGGAPYNVPANGSRDLVFTMTVPNSPGGPYGCSATATRADFPAEVATTASTTNITVAELALPNITSILPNPASVGGTVTITGTSFTGVSSISFNGTACTSFTVNSDTSITATVPDGTTSGNVTVTNSAGTSNGVSLTINQPPVITLLNPTSGPASTTVVITGQNFTGTTAVSFGGVPATSFNVDSPTQITCVVPNNYGNLVTVTANGAVSNQVQYGAPIITSLAPDAGLPGATVTINGNGFTGATAVSFGGVPATSFTIIDDNTVQAVVPGGAGTWVTVTGPTGTSNQAPFGAPIITSLTPSAAPAGSTIVIAGFGFAGATAVDFGGVPATSFTYDDEGIIQAVVPAGAGTWVTVTTPRGISNQAPFGAPAITSLSPSTAAAATTITITGSTFTGATAVSFGGVPATSFIVINDTTIQAVVPSGAGAWVTVTGPLGTSNQAPFTAAGTLSGNVVVTTNGANGVHATTNTSGGLTLSPFKIGNTGTVQQFLYQVTISIDNPSLFSSATLTATSAAGTRTVTLTQIGTSNVFVLSTPLLLQPGEEATLNLALVTVRSGGGSGGLTVLAFMFPLLFIPRRTRKYFAMLLVTGIFTMTLAGCGGGGGGINGQRDGAYAIDNGATGVANVDLTQIVAKGPANETVVYSNLPARLYTISII